MAVDANVYPQSYASPLKPSVLADNLPSYLGDVRRRLAGVMVQGALVVHAWIAPWDGVIESVRNTQLVAGGGAGGQNSITMAVGGVSVFAAATDGNTVLDNAAANSSALTYPTAVALLIEQDDGVDRVEFSMGDVIAIGAVAAAGAYGTAETEIVIARKVPYRV